MAPRFRLLAACTLVLLLAFPSALAGGNDSRPHRDTLVFAGFVSCSIGLRPLQTQDICNQPWQPWYDPNARSRHNFTIDAGLTAISLTLTWEGGSAVNVGDTLSVTWTAPRGITPSTLSGYSPIEGTWGWDEPFTSNQASAVLDVRAASGGPIGNWQGASVLVWQQRYDLCIVLYYHGAEEREHDDPCAHLLE